MRFDSKRDMTIVVVVLMRKRNAKGYFKVQEPRHAVILCHYQSAGMNKGKFPKFELQQFQQNIKGSSPTENPFTKTMHVAG